MADYVRARLCGEMDSGNIVYNKDRGSEKPSACVVYKNDSSRIKITGVASGSLLVMCNLLEEVGAVFSANNNSITLVLRANVLEQNTSTVDAGSVLQVSLQDFNSYQNTEFGLDKSHIQWTNEYTVDWDRKRTFYWIESADNVVKSTYYSG